MKVNWLIIFRSIINLCTKWNSYFRVSGVYVVTSTGRYLCSCVNYYKKRYEVKGTNTHKQINKTLTGITKKFPNGIKENPYSCSHPVLSTVK